MTVSDPPRVDLALSLVAALGVVAAISTTAVLPVAVATGGLLLFAIGLLWRSRTWLSGGALALFGGAVTAALVASRPLPVLLGGAAAMLAWDVGERALTLGEQLGRAGATRRLRVARTGSSATVGALGVGTGYAVLTVGAGSIPLLALVALLLGTVVVVALLGD